MPGGSLTAVVLIVFSRRVDNILVVSGGGSPKKAVKLNSFC